MRIRLNNCSTEEIKKYLDDIVDTYDVNIGTINLYLSLNKNGKKCEVYDLSSLMPVFIDDKEKSFIRDYVCLTSNNIRVINYTFKCINNWTNSSKNLMKSFLIFKFSNLSNTINKIEDPSLAEVYEILEEIYNKIIEDIERINQLNRDEDE